MLLLLLLVVPAALAWDPAEGDVPWQPEEIALFELVSKHKYVNLNVLDRI